MHQLDEASLGPVRAWLSSRQVPNDNIGHYQANVVVRPSGAAAALALPDLHLTRYARHSPTADHQTVHRPHLGQLVKWLNEFVCQLREHRDQLHTLEQIANGFRSQLAEFHVQEAIGLVASSLCLDVALDVRLDRAECAPARPGEHSILDTLRLVLVRLFVRAPVSLVLDQAHYPGCLLAAYLVDLMHKSGAPRHHVGLFVQESGARATGEPTPTGQAVFVCLANADVHQVPAVILETYLREPACPNAIVLVEESAYGSFVDAWRHNFSRALQASDLQLLEIAVDLNSIDVGVARRTQGRCINVVRFRSLDELHKLTGSLRRVAHVQLWTSDHLVARELCLGAANRLGPCQEFWLNHLPACLAGARFPDQLLAFYADTLRGPPMDECYSGALHEHGAQINRLRRQQVAFARHSNSARARLVLGAYVRLVAKLKSLKPTGVSAAEAVARLRRFQWAASGLAPELAGGSRVETAWRPTGLAILLLASKACVKSRSVVAEFVFKNLLVGNAVLLVCPPDLLGPRFPADLLAAGRLPFGLVHAGAPQAGAGAWPPLASAPGGSPAAPSPGQTAGQLEQEGSSAWGSADSGLDITGGSVELRRRVRCPKSVYALELRQADDELTSERVETLVTALGCRRRSLWYPDGRSHHVRLLIDADSQED